MDDVMVHASARQALRGAEDFSFVGDGEDDGVCSDVSGASFPCRVDSHRERNAHGQIVTNDDVVELLDLGLFTTSRIAKRVKRSWSWIPA